MERKDVAKILEILAGLSFITASLFISQITGAVIGTSPAMNEKIGGIIAATGLIFTAFFIVAKYKKQPALC